MQVTMSLAGRVLRMPGAACGRAVGMGGAVVGLGTAGPGTCWVPIFRDACWGAGSWEEAVSQSPPRRHSVGS
jgi:hypothetical protein